MWRDIRNQELKAMAFSLKGKTVQGRNLMQQFTKYMKKGEVSAAWNKLRRL
jgi:hypothetical protein